MNTAMVQAVSASLADPLTLLAAADALEESGDLLLAGDYRALYSLVEQHPGLGRDLDRVTHARYFADRLLTVRKDRERGYYHRCLATARQQHGWFSDMHVAFKMQPRERADLRRRISVAGEPFPVETLRGLLPLSRLRVSQVSHVEPISDHLVCLNFPGQTIWLPATQVGLILRRYPLAVFYSAKSPKGSCVVVVAPGHSQPVAYLMAMKM